MAAKESGNFLTKKAGPLPRWGWAAAAGGTFIVYRYIKARQASSAATTSTALTGGDLIPNDIGLPSSSTSTGQGSFSSVAGWTQAALDFMTSNGLDSADSLNAITSWLNGNCVTQQGYNAISAAITNQSIGLPPGYNALPSLSVCPSASAPTTGPAPTPAAPSAPAASPIATALAQIDAAAWPQVVSAATDGNIGKDFTQIGTWVGGNNGIGGYEGSGVLGGAPVYAYVDGAWRQGFNPQSLPSGTPIAIPTTLNQQGYSNGVASPL